jgi:cobalt-zinc-cadmium efflux system outer membrane protein
MLLLILLIPFLYGKVQAQQQADTLKLSLPEAEKLFLQKNLSLLAQQYNMDISKAFVQQAKYWDNPLLVTDQNIYDGKFFRHTSNSGQVYIQIQQLIKTAGKRNKLVQLANDAVLTSQQQFNDVMRNLRYLMYTHFNDLNQLLQINTIYNNEADAMQRLAKGMDAQLAAGNIALKDNIRIKALLYGLQSDQADLQRQIVDIQKDLHVLLQAKDSTFILPQVSGISAAPVPTLQQLLDTARANRPEVQLSNINLLQQQHNLSYQNALKVPDVTVGVEYDRLNSYALNYYGLAISLPLPLLNKNKGNIRAASLSVQQAQTGVQLAQNQVEQDVTAAYHKFLIAANLKQATAPELDTKFDELMQNMINSYRQRQVSLIEFIDFFGSYKDSRIKRLEQENNLRNAGAEINFTTNSNMINLNQ